MEKRSAEWGKGGPLTDALRRELRAARHRLGFTQDRLAVWLQKVGVPWDRDTVAAFERGVRGVSPEELLELMQALQIDESALFGGGVRMPSGTVRSGFPRNRDHAEDAEIAEGWVAGDEEQARARVRRQAEERTAQALGLSTTELQRVARRLWGRGFIEERDLRIEERFAGDEEEPSAVSLIRVRGHVTKRLRDEIQTDLAQKRRGKGRKRGKH